ncbi:MAG: hypothetical protein ACRD2X_08440 [Vicinamibacteraceae bacterium]
MLKASIVRGWRPKAPGIAMALALSLGAATIVEAQQVQTFPGSSCQASGSAQSLYYSGVIVANRGSSTKSAVCPVVRQNPTQAWSQIAVFVRDRHSRRDISCVAQARDTDGAAGTGWSETQSTAGEGNQLLLFGAPGSALPDFGPYTVVCSLPPMEEANQPSYIASYVIVEP